MFRMYLLLCEVINMKLLFFSSFIRKLRQKGGGSFISKREEFVIVSLLLTGGLLLTQLLSDYRYPMTIILSLATYGMSAFVLRHDLKGVEFFTLLSLPTLFTMAVTLFYFLLPVRWITRIPVATLYIMGMYALLLTENIYNVASNRTIALLRAAHTVGFLITLVTYFLLLSTVFALRFHAIPTMLLVGGITCILTLQILWAVELTQVISKKLLEISIAITCIFIQFSWILSFWSVKSTMKALLLTTCFYSIVGLAQQYLVERMYRKTIVEFSTVLIVVSIIFLLVTNWRGTF
jgi:hypothetical protein